MDGATVAKLFTVRDSLTFKSESSRITSKKTRMGVANKRPKEKEVKPVAIFGLSKVTQGRLFVMGRVLMYACFVTFIGSYLSYEWVCRVFDPSDITHTLGRPPKVTLGDLYCFGLWKTCDGKGDCDSVWKNLPNISAFVAMWVQTLATCTLLCYGVALVMDAASRVTLLLFIAINRVVEFFMAVAAVVHFLTLLHFTGQIKNEVVRQHQVRDAAGWGFGLTVTSLCLAVLSVLIMAVFRIPPGKYKHRRFWKMPEELRPRSYLATTDAAIPEPISGVVMVRESPAPRMEPEVMSRVLPLKPRAPTTEKSH